MHVKGAAVKDGEGDIGRVRDGACKNGRAYRFHFHLRDINIFIRGSARLPFV